MSTTQVAATLFQLQILDLEMDRLVAEQQALASSLQSNEPLKRLRAELAIAQQQLVNGLQGQKEAEWGLEELDQRLKQQEQRLYSGSVSNPKELNALQQEVHHLRRQQARQEEKALEIMEAAENLREAVERKTRAVNQAEEAWTLANAAGVSRREQLEAHQQELRTKRAGVATTLDSDLLKRYESVRKSKQGRAVSKVEQNSCQWCRVILTPSELQRVRISPDLQTCGNCGRILYYDR